VINFNNKQNLIFSIKVIKKDDEIFFFKLRKIMYNMFKLYFNRVLIGFFSPSRLHSIVIEKFSFMNSLS
jgi:hypothetical protein